MTEEYKEKIANIEREVALANQFNKEVIKPFIIEAKASLKDQPSRKEFDEYKESHEEEHQRMWKAINKKPILSTVLWTLFGSILTAVVIYEVMRAIGAR